VNFRACLVVERRNTCPYRESNSGRPSRILVIRLTELPASCAATHNDDDDDDDDNNNNNNNNNSLKALNIQKYPDTELKVMTLSPNVEWYEHF